MYLGRDEQDWAYIPVEGLPAGVTPVARFGAGGWVPLLAHTATEWKILLRGPDTPEDEAALLISDPVTPVRVRAASAPVTAWKYAGPIYLTT